jgi:16S rRNA (adenine1518-N6/adenine1519-N6)-dimethyltransferase
MQKTSLKYQTKILLEKYGVSPKKYMGQNFLIDKKILAKIIKTADLKKQDTVLEIGAGTGILTKELAKKAKKVIAIEKDKNLIKILKKELKKENIKNVEIIEGNALFLEKSSLKLPNNYKIVANLPYYISARVLRKFLEEIPQKKQGKRPKLMVVTVQKEVAKRICATPGNMNILAVSVQLYSCPKIVKVIKKESFWPKPKVDGAILKLKIKNKIPKIDIKKFFKIIKIGFSSPRKQIKNNLKKVFGKETEEFLKKARINPESRPEEINLENWLNFYKILKN